MTVIPVDPQVPFSPPSVCGIMVSLTTLSRFVQLSYLLWRSRNSRDGFVCTLCFPTSIITLAIHFVIHLMPGRGGGLLKGIMIAKQGLGFRA